MSVSLDFKRSNCPLTFGSLVLRINRMKTWALKEDAPLCLTLSADARFGGTDYADDQIWDLTWWNQEIPSVGLFTCYGRRAQSMRIFPAFSLGGQTRQDPKGFTEPPIIRQVLPNLATLEFQPFDALSVQAEYYVPESHAIAGRYTLQNLSAMPQVISLRLSAFLQPGEQPNPMGLEEFQGVATLSGRTANLYPVVFLSGGAQKVHSAYPSLQVAATLAPGGSKTWVWVHAALKQPDDSFDACRGLAQIPWESTMARIEMENGRMLSIETGDPDWDAVLWMTQKELLRGFMGPTPHNSRFGLIGRRMPEDGFAQTSDGRDHVGAWGGLSTTDMFYLACQSLSIKPELAQDLLGNVLRTQNSEGELDWAPGMGGQRAGFQAVPCLATLAWEIYRRTEDQAYLEQVFPGLFSFYESWFTKRHDRDEDGFPEWDHVLQSGFDDRPTFSRFGPWAQGFEIAQAETVDLAAYLYREGQSLISIATELGREGLTTLIRARINSLAERVENTWSEKRSTYQHVDWESHLTHPGLQLGKRRGSFSLNVNRDLDPPARLLFRLKGDPALAKSLKVETVSHGARGRKRKESFTHRKFQAFFDWSTHTTSKLNYRVESVRVKGIDKKMTMEVVIPDLEREELLLALPIWAGWMDPPRARVLIEETITNSERYWRENGLASIPATDRSYASDHESGLGSVRMLWNYLIGLGLVEHGFREEAGQIFQLLMNTTVNILKRERGFYGSYHADEIRGIGLKGAIQGIPPLDLFLAVLGVRIVSPTKVWVEVGHPFPWPVKLEWQGLSLLCEHDYVRITFPDGQEVTVVERGMQCVEQLDPRPVEEPTPLES
jgi:hypothetical protein